MKPSDFLPGQEIKVWDLHQRPGARGDCGEAATSEFAAPGLLPRPKPPRGGVQ